VGFAQQDSTTNSERQDDFDVDALVDRVAHSKALGFFTKLSLKQEIDQLMTGIRAHHNASQDYPIEQLRERYDVMVKKLMILLQEKDQELVQEIHNGRGKLWAILSDEKKFASM
jgi:Ni,Fe-hydrogenase maturation factor